MKKYIFILGLTAMGLVSCEKDYLDTTPEGEVDTKTILSSTDNSTLSIAGIAKSMTSQYLHSQGFNGEGTIKTWYGNYPGNDFQKSNLTGWSPIINSQYHLQLSSSYDTYPWYYYYKLVSNANAIIENIDAAEGTEQQKAFIKAQALTDRAYSFFMLSQIYSKRWADEQGNARGIVLRLDQTTGDQACATLGETYAQVYKDLDEAISLFKSSGIHRAASDFHLPDLEVAYAVYAKAALTRQDWQNAANYAKLARENYKLMSNSDYLNGGMHTQNSEWIWGVYEPSDKTLYYYSFFAYQGSNSSAGACRNYPCAISRELIDQIPETDVRRSLYLVPQTEEEFAEAFPKAGNPASCTKGLRTRARNEFGSKLYSTSLVFPYMQTKFTVDFLPGGGSFPIIRSAEMYYIEAEAYCMLGQDAQAQELLYQLESPRDPAYTKSEKTGSDLLEEVKLYRRFDLWGEGLDWFDYKRWKQPIVRKTYANGGSFHSTFAKSFDVADANDWTWGIPKFETDYNSLVSQ